MKELIPSEMIERKILMIRGQKVIIDSELAELYDVTTKHLNQQIKRNISRFPKDFMFQLTEKETASMRSQIVTASDSDAVRSQNATASKRNVRYLPYAFTEHGVIMAASVLNSQRAIDVSVYVVRAFSRLRQMLAANKELAQKLSELERKVESHDGAIRSLVTAIRQLMAAPEPKEKKIGFIVKERGAKYRTTRSAR
jgi:cell division septum initiation protein DivIVA